MEPTLQPDAAYVDKPIGPPDLAGLDPEQTADFMGYVLAFGAVPESVKSRMQGSHPVQSLIGRIRGNETERKRWTIGALGMNWYGYIGGPMHDPARPGSALERQDDHRRLLAGQRDPDPGEPRDLAGVKTVRALEGILDTSHWIWHPHEPKHAVGAYNASRLVVLLGVPDLDGRYLALKDAGVLAPLRCFGRQIEEYGPSSVRVLR